MTRILILSLTLNLCLVAFISLGFFKKDESKPLKEKIAQNKKWIEENEKIIEKSKKELKALSQRDYLVNYDAEEGVLSWRAK